MVWKLEQGAAAEHTETDRESQGQSTLPASSAQRPIFRTAASARAMEIDLAADPDQTGAGAAPKPHGQLVTDLTEHGQRFVLCKGGRGGLGNRNFATAARQAPDKTASSNLPSGARWCSANSQRDSIARRGGPRDLWLSA